MANFAPSNLVAGQAKFNERYLSGEWRMPDFAALSVADTGAKANPLLAELRTREDRAVNAYFPIRQAATDGTARSHAHTGARGDSQAEAISWTTFSEPFSISIKQGDNNVYDFAEMFAASQQNGLFNLLDRVDAWFVAQLLADKTQINVGGGNGAFNGVSFNYEVAQADKDFFYENVKAMMQQNLYRGQLTGILDSTANVLARKVGNQGTGNQTNEAYQLLGYDNLVASTRSILDVPTTFSESGIFFETGKVGIVPWIPRQNRKALDPEKAMSYNGDYGFIDMPGIPNMPVAVHAYAERADASGLNGGTQDLVLQYELSVDVGYVSAPLSDFRGADDSVVYTAGVTQV